MQTVQNVLEIVLGVGIWEILYDTYRRWRKRRRMQELNRLSQLKRRKKSSAASIQSDAGAS